MLLNQEMQIGFINIVAILMMLAKMAALDFLKVKVFWNKDYDVTVSIHDVINKTCHLTQVILQMWLFDRSLVTLAFL